MTIGQICAMLTAAQATVSNFRIEYDKRGIHVVIDMETETADDDEIEDDYASIILDEKYEEN